MKNQTPDGTRPVAVYTDFEGLDISEGVRMLEEAGFEVRLLETLDFSTIINGAQDASALLVSYAQISAEIIASLPNLRIIALMSMGVNNVDVNEARTRSIWVTNVGNIATEEVATHALTLMLQLVRQTGAFEQFALAGDWVSRPELPVLRTSRLTLGIIGLGRIGQQVAALAGPTFGDIVGFDPFLQDDARVSSQPSSQNIRRVEKLEELLASSDIVSLHVPATPETEGLVDAAFLSRMRPGSYLVNVSRGSLVDSAALCEALDSRHIAGAGLDVLETEPAPSDHPLVRHRRTIVTPHAAYYSEFTNLEYVRVQAKNVTSWYKLGAPENAV